MAAPPDRRMQGAATMCDAPASNQGPVLDAKVDLQASFAAAWARCAPPASGGVVAAVCRVDQWMPWLPDASELLDEAERARAQRMKRAHDADTRALAYALHRLFLGELQGVPPGEVALWRDPNGRPMVGDGTWCTSLSHADGVVALAASRGGEVGIDVEPADRAAGMAAIAEEVWHPAEFAGMERATRAERGRALLETWVRKEAYLKASGVGLLAPMAQFALPESMVLPLLHDGERPALVRTGLLELLPGYVVALCAAPTQPVHGMLLEPARS